MVSSRGVTMAAAQLVSSGAVRLDAPDRSAGETNRGRGVATCPPSRTNKHNLCTDRRSEHNLVDLPRRVCQWQNTTILTGGKDPRSSSVDTVCSTAFENSHPGQTLILAATLNDIVPVFGFDMTETMWNVVADLRAALGPSLDLTCAQASGGGKFSHASRVRWHVFLWRGQPMSTRDTQG